MLQGLKERRAPQGYQVKMVHMENLETQDHKVNNTGGAIDPRAPMGFTKTISVCVCWSGLQGDPGRDGERGLIGFIGPPGDIGFTGWPGKFTSHHTKKDLLSWYKQHLYLQRVRDSRIVE